MTDRTAGQIAITASTTSLELMQFLVSISSGITPVKLMDAVKELTTRTNNEKIGALAIGSSMNIRRVINDVRSKAGITLPESWQINGEVNFSMLALLGHAFFLLPIGSLTPEAEAARATYVKTIGGAASIKTFNASVVIPGKEKRAEILLKYANMLADFDVGKYQSLLARTFPNVVKDTRGIAARVSSLLYGTIMAPFNLVWMIVKSVWGMSRGVVLATLIFLACYAIAYFVGAEIIPSIGRAASVLINTPWSHVPSATLPEKIFKTAAVTSSVALRLPGVYWNTLLSTPSYAFSAVVSVGSMIPMVIEGASKAYATGGKSVSEQFDKFDYATLPQITKEAAKGVGEYAAKNVISVVLGEDVEVDFSAFNSSVYAEMMEGINRDVYGVAESPEAEEAETEEATGIPPAPTRPPDVTAKDALTPPNKTGAGGTAGMSP
jgi:hypothetical protein